LAAARHDQLDAVGWSPAPPTAGASWSPRPRQIGAQPLTPRTSTDPPPALTQLSITQLKLLHETLSHLN
jgi:hypothetical protein